MNIPGLPPKQGLYDPQHEKDWHVKDWHVIVFVGNIAIVKQESPKGYRERSR